MDVTEALPRADFAARPATTTPVPTAPGASPVAAQNFATQVQLAKGTPAAAPAIPLVAVASSTPPLVDFTPLEITIGLFQPSLTPSTSDPRLPVTITQLTPAETGAVAPLSVAAPVVVTTSETPDPRETEDIPSDQNLGSISVLAAIAQSFAAQPVATNVFQTKKVVDTAQTVTEPNVDGHSAVDASDGEAKPLASAAPAPPAEFAQSLVRSLQETAKVTPSTDVSPTAPATILASRSITTSVAQAPPERTSSAPAATDPSAAVAAPESAPEALRGRPSRTVATDNGDVLPSSARNAEERSDDDLQPKTVVSENSQSLLPAATLSAPVTQSAVRPVDSDQSSASEPAAARPKISALHASPASSQTATSLPGVTSSEDNAPIAATISPHDSQQLVEQLSQLVLASHDRGEQLVARVSPPDMGTIVIDLQSQGGDLVVRMEASSVDAQQLLVEHLPQLHETLNHLGLTTERIEIVRSDTSAVQESGLSANVGDQGMTQSQSQQQSEAERQRQLELEQAQRQRATNATKVPVTLQRLQELNVRV